VTGRVQVSPRLKTTAMIAGCGDIGGRLAQRLRSRGWDIYGLCRQVGTLSEGIIRVAGDLHDSRCPEHWPEHALDYLVYCAAARQHDASGYHLTYVQGLRHVLGWLRQHGQTPRRLLFVSSSGVYAQNDGGWIDEGAPTQPQNYSGRLMLEAERLLLDSEWASSVVRLTGIYGPGRNWLLNQVRGGYQVPPVPPLYSNRIHADDAAHLLEFLLVTDARGQPLEDCYLGVDDEPAALHEVVDWLRQRLGVEHRATASATRRSGSKRCSNARARKLGWKPQYPSFREGYAALLRED
jgi:nucleoside-diphosphate-sugar epimerase